MRTWHGSRSYNELIVNAPEKSVMHSPERTARRQRPNWHVDAKWVSGPAPVRPLERQPGLLALELTFALGRFFRRRAAGPA